MMIPEYALNAEDVRGMVLEVMEQHLSLKTEGYCSTTNETFNLLLKAAAEGSSLEAVCADSCGAMASNTLREQVNAALEVSALRQQEAEMNAALAAAIPRGMPRGGLEVALDTHDEPFYGKTPELLAVHYEAGGVVRRAIAELGGTMPEDLPTAESIKTLERAAKKRLTAPKRNPKTDT